MNTQNFSVRRFAPSLSGLAMSGPWLFMVRFCQVVFSVDPTVKRRSPIIGCAVAPALC